MYHHVDTANIDNPIVGIRIQVESNAFVKYTIKVIDNTPVPTMVMGWHHHGLSDHTLSGSSKGSSSLRSADPRVSFERANVRGCVRARETRKVVDGNVRTIRLNGRRDLLMLAAWTMLFERRASAEPNDAYDGFETDAGANDVVYMEIGVDGIPLGTVWIRVLDPNSIGGRRFMELIRGNQGVGYKKTSFSRVSGSHVYDSGVRTFDALDGKTKMDSIVGDSSYPLLEELQKTRRKHDVPGLVSLEVFRDDSDFVPKERLIATGGKLISVKDSPPPQPNGSAFVITTRADETLDGTHLVVGRVIQGMEYVQKLQELPVVQDNARSPLFMMAQSMGDKRAKVAEQSFGKPFSKVNVLRCGRIQEQT